MKETGYWNHNTAYYNWIKQQVSDCKSVLDVGCGDGTLICFLDDGIKDLVGIDADEPCIEKACNQTQSAKVHFIHSGFEDYAPNRTFDAIVFVASIHHMDMNTAIQKAKTLLSDNGLLLIVGLAKPAAVKDYLTEALRVLPCMIISKLKHIHPNEEEHIPVSYDIPSMNNVRKISGKTLPNCHISQGLFYRYLLKWEKQTNCDACK